jgi:murein DD-endopeptidase MepM/ murein hydrolase activator NlpD
MRKKLSFVILSNTGSPARQVCTSKTAIVLFGVFLLAFLTGVGYIVYDYYTLRYNQRQLAAYLESQELAVSFQENEIHAQRRQIQEFATEINALKAKLVALNSFENKIRTIANLDNPDESETVFGIGGSAPEDLDPEIPLKEKHNSLIRDMHEQIEELNRASANQQEEFESLLKSLEDQQNLLASTPAIRPLSKDAKLWITSKFGHRISPFTGRREFHKGYDISAKEGTPIMATADGVVTFVGNKGLLGEVISIDHGHGYVTVYGHCQKFLKKAGQKVKRWEPIALVGNSGRSTGPHVHYEVQLNGIPVNPEKYILN